MLFQVNWGEIDFKIIIIILFHIIWDHQTDFKNYYKKEK